MARKKSIRVRVAGSGATVAVTFPRERMDELIATLPEGELKRMLVLGQEQAEERAARIDRNGRLNDGLSAEALELMGWEMIDHQSAVAAVGIRSGDFRHVEVQGSTGWEYGRRGAFDRDPEGGQVLRGAVQVGVFSRNQCAYRLLEPVTDVAQAHAAAAALLAEWSAAIRGMPKAAFDIEDHARVRAMAALPEGARPALSSLPHGDYAGSHSRDADEMPYGSWDDGHVTIFPCEAVLRPVRRMDEGCGRALVESTDWSTGRRGPVPFDRRQVSYGPLDGPFDVVLGTSWTVWTNSNVNEDVGYPRQISGATSREEALEQARAMAEAYGIGPAVPEREAA